MLVGETVLKTNEQTNNKQTNDSGIPIELAALRNL